ncbi:fibrinogen-like protein 1 [Anopheles darlingi]|uniref:fibrinogen-like protein 1 n=1 Tax=Anopheles darlingi TaxID=43151 RepID=UPI00210019F2|nr:fibrinogen-like protein 1 [Anopheles darlingi]
MYRLTRFILLAVIVASISGEPKASNKGEEVHRNNQHSSAVWGFPLEVLRTEHDTIRYQLQLLHQDVQDQRESNVKNQELLIQTLELLAKMQLEMQQRHTESQQTIADIQRKQEQNRNSFDSITEKLDELKSTLFTQGVEDKKNQKESENRMEQLDRDHKQMQNSLLDIQLGYRSCKDVPMKVSGKYKIRVNNESASFEAYCNQQQVGGGWMVIQQRWDGTENFNRNWTDYWLGFGEVDREHWLGLERIHQFTKKHNCELLVELIDFNSTFKHAWYDSFAIGSAAEGYNLKTLGTYKGTAGDSLKQHKGMKFSTPDRDKDSSAGSNCAKEYQGGWWFHACHNSFLNGLYRNVTGLTEERISWSSFSDDYRGLYYSRMMIRPLH